jgi:hypothetical protein
MSRSWDQVIGLGTWDDLVDQGFTWDGLLELDTLPPEPIPPIPELPEPPPRVGFRSTGEDLFEGTYPAAFADSETNGAWRKLCDSLGELLDPIAEVTRPDDGSEPWVVLASPRRCPTDWLRVLAQWAGIRRPDVMSESDLRELIGNGGPGMWRGTRANMIAAARRFLPPGTPDHLLYFEERADLGAGHERAYGLRVFTYTFIDHDPALVRAALEAAKPAGIILDYQVRHGQAWFMLRNRRASWAEVNATYDSWREVHRDQPTLRGETE